METAMKFVDQLQNLVDDYVYQKKLSFALDQESRAAREKAEQARENLREAQHAVYAALGEFLDNQVGELS